ncbi:hypothetical protein CON39_12030 [Bacillus thuringiensis]|uniref:hypothetical protein n=1 Tax=Bacillus thuringiensis TaxID=1428 RepID=UPI000BEB54E1|nr:hypothetical protein [Bacillus thuringiensis]PEF30393.1 hypothetical protein CON39_12030 [Bacillus thuringiensis]
MTKELAINIIGMAKMHGKALIGSDVDYVIFRTIIESDSMLGKVWHEYLRTEVEGLGDDEKWYLIHDENKLK